VQQAQIAEIEVRRVKANELASSDIMPPKE
jgi:hypothetical protein